MKSLNEQLWSTLNETNDNYSVQGKCDECDRCEEFCLRDECYCNCDCYCQGMCYC